MSTSHDKGLPRHPNCDYVELTQLDKIIKLKTKFGRTRRYKLPDKRIVKMITDPFTDPAEFRYEMFCKLNSLKFDALTPISELTESEFELFRHPRGHTPHSRGKRGDEYFSTRFDRKSRSVPRIDAAETVWSTNSGLEKVGGGQWDPIRKHHLPYFQRSLIEGIVVDVELFVPSVPGSSEENEQLRLIEFDCWLAGEIFRQIPPAHVEEITTADIDMDPAADPTDGSSEDQSETEEAKDVPTVNSRPKGGRLPREHISLGSGPRRGR
jgi:hypothetical protein